MLAITVFIGGLSIYEVDQFVQKQTEDFIDVTCEKEASQINDIFGDMEKSVRIMESYVYGLIESEIDVKDAMSYFETLCLKALFHMCYSVRFQRHNLCLKAL